jgi:hypothetical protein
VRRSSWWAQKTGSADASPPTLPNHGDRRRHLADAPIRGRGTSTGLLNARARGLRVVVCVGRYLTHARQSGCHRGRHSATVISFGGLLSPRPSLPTGATPGAPMPTCSDALRLRRLRPPAAAPPRSSGCAAASRAPSPVAEACVPCPSILRPHKGLVHENVATEKEDGTGRTGVLRGRLSVLRVASSPPTYRRQPHAARTRRASWQAAWDGITARNACASA